MDGLSHYLAAPRSIWPWVLAVVFIGVSVGIAYEGFRQYERAEEAIDRSMRILDAKARATPPTPKPAELEVQKRWGALKAERNFDWEPIFVAIEGATNNSIELLEFHPEKVSRRIALRGEARDRNALIKYISALAAQGALRNVHLTRQETVTRDNGLETVSFEIKATLAGN